jgi:predicted nucleic acid-binding protein
MTILIDSDILIEVSRRRNDDVLTRWSELTTADTELSCSAVSEMELWAGALPREFEATTNLLDSLDCVPVDREIGRDAGHLLRRYAKSHGMGLADALIAATALRTGAALWTRNRKHYPMPELSFY